MGSSCCCEEHSGSNGGAIEKENWSSLAFDESTNSKLSDYVVQKEPKDVLKENSTRLKPSDAEVIGGPGNDGQVVLNSEALRGMWMDGSDGQPMGTIDPQESGAWIRWDERFETDQATSLQATGPKEVAMDFDGDSISAVYERRSARSGAATLTWGDGAVWLREELQGSWVGDEDDLPLGTVVKGEVHWEPDYNHPPSPLTPIPPEVGSTIRVTLAGVEYSGTFAQGPPATLHWSDGQVWRRTTLH